MSSGVPGWPGEWFENGKAGNLGDLVKIFGVFGKLFPWFQQNQEAIKEIMEVYNKHEGAINDLMKTLEEAKAAAPKEEKSE